MDEVDQNLVRAVEDRYFRYFRRRNQVAPGATRRRDYLWDVIQSVLERGVPTLYDAVALGDDIWLLIVIDGAAHLVFADDTEGVAISVGTLEGGTYTERVYGTDDGPELRGTFEHERLATPITIYAHEWSEFKPTKPLRDYLRDRASAT